MTITGLDRIRRAPTADVWEWRTLPDGSDLEIRSYDQRDEKGNGYIVRDWATDGNYPENGCIRWQTFRRKKDALRYYTDFDRVQL